MEEEITSERMSSDEEFNPDRKFYGERTLRQDFE